MRKCPICDKSDIPDESQSCPNPDCLWEFEVWLGATKQDKERYRKRVEVARRNYQAAQILAKGAGVEAGTAGKNAGIQKQGRENKSENQSEYPPGNELSRKDPIIDSWTNKTIDQNHPTFTDPEETGRKNIQTSSKSTKIADNGDIYEGNFVNGQPSGKAANQKNKTNQHTIKKLNATPQYKAPVSEKKENQPQPQSQTQSVKQSTLQTILAKDMADNIYSGKYACLFPNGDIYEGDFSYNKFSGNGKFIWANGLIYEGRFENGMKINGKLTYPNGTIFEGDVHNCTLSPNCRGTPYPENGKLTYPDGTVYEGKFHDHRPSGKGRLIYKNGDVFKGNFINGQPSGPNAFRHSKKNANPSVKKKKGGVAKVNSGQQKKKSVANGKEEEEEEKKKAKEEQKYWNQLSKIGGFFPDFSVWQFIKICAGIFGFFMLLTLFIAHPILATMIVILTIIVGIIVIQVFHDFWMDYPILLLTMIFTSILIIVLNVVSWFGFQFNF